MNWLVVLSIAAWFYFGHPARNVANLIWKESPAPWEMVDEYYYPDNNDLSKYDFDFGLKSISACQSMAKNRAYIHNDPLMLHSSYICGVGREGGDKEFPLYRLKVK